MPPIGSHDDTPGPGRRISRAWVLDETATIPIDRSRVSSSTKVAWTIGSFLVAVGFFVGVQLTRVQYQLNGQSTETARLAGELSKLRTTVKQVRRAAVKAATQTVSTGIVTCPREALRGHGDVRCPAVFNGVVTEVIEEGSPE